MAYLPHQVQITSHDPDRFLHAVQWCDTQWPHTRGATWYVNINNLKFDGTAQRMWMLRFMFQRKEDAVSFELAFS